MECDLRQAASRLNVKYFDGSDQRDDVVTHFGTRHVPGDGLKQSSAEGFGTTDVGNQFNALVEHIDKGNAR